MSNGDDHISQIESETNALPLCDPQGLASLAGVLPVDKVVEIITLCLVDAREKTDLILHAADVDNWIDVGSYAHDVKSTAGQIGAARLQNLAKRLEECCRTGNTDEAPDLVIAFKTATARTAERYADDKIAAIIASAAA